MILKFEWLVLALTSALLAFKTNLHSDSLFLDAVMSDIFDRGGSWGDWKMTPAPAYFPDMLIYAVSYHLIPTPALRITFVCVVQALLLAFALNNLAKTIQPSRSKWQSNFVLLLISIFALVAANSSMWLFFNSTNNHFAALLFPSLVGWMIFRYWDYKNRWSIFWLIAFVFSGASSTPIFFLSFTIPFLAFASLVIIAFRQDKFVRYFFIKVACYIFIGHGIASIFNTAVVSYDAFSGRAPITIDSAKRSLGFFFEATKLTFGLENSFTFALSVFSLAAIGVIFFDFLKIFSLKLGDGIEKTNSCILFDVPSSRLRYLSAFVFLMIALPLSVVGSLASGGFADAFGYRYFAFPIALGLLLFILRFDEVIIGKFLFKKNVIDFSLIILLSIIVILGALSAKNLFLNSGRESIVSLFDKGIRNVSDEIAHCIENEMAGGFKFQAGVADFWGSRGVAYKVKDIPFILPVTNDLRPFFHMMTLGPLLNPKKYDVPPYNFIIASKSGTTTQFNMTPEIIGGISPPPTKIVNCENTDFSLWLYDDLKLDNLIKSNVAHFLLQLGRSQSFSMSGSAFPGQIGKSVSTSRVGNSDLDSPGFLAYGPYVKIPRGKYRVVISYEATENGNRWDAGRFNDPAKNITVGSGNLAAGRGVLSYEFELEKSLDQFEIRVWFDGAGSIVLNDISIGPVDR